MNKNKGFTLIELLVVLTIITILTGAVLAGLSGFRASARDTGRISDLRNVQTYLELYFNKCGRYPGGVGVPCSSTNPASWEDLRTALGTVMNPTDVPNDPVASRSYEYGVDVAPGQEGLRYVIGAQLERDNSVLKSDDSPNWAPTPPVECDDLTFHYCVES